MAEARRELATQTGGFGYHAILTLIRVARAIGTRPSYVGREYFPRTGGVLLVSNHLSLADPVVLMSASPRPLAFMAKEELWRNPVARAILNFWGGSFPVRRGQADIGAVRDALELLRAGYPVVLFPEGTRHPEGLGTALPGVGYIASRAGCPIVPVAISGTDRIRGIQALVRRPAFSVRFGEPFYLDKSTASSGDIVPLVMGRIAALLPPERRGMYAADAFAMQSSGDSLRNPPQEGVQP